MITSRITLTTIGLSTVLAGSVGVLLTTSYHPFSSGEGRGDGVHPDITYTVRVQSVTSDETDAATGEPVIGRVIAEWPAEPGISYSVQRRDEISDWTEIELLTEGAGRFERGLCVMDAPDQWRVARQ